jgi:uncharacterized protein
MFADLSEYPWVRPISRSTSPKDLVLAAHSFHDAGNLAAVTAALEKGANVDARDAGFGRTRLDDRIMHSAIPIMRALLDAGANINLQAVLGETVLILAASGRGGESIELLLARGADPNLADRKKKTPLMWMVDTQFHRGVDTSLSIAPLVEAGARVNDRDAAGHELGAKDFAQDTWNVLADLIPTERVR